MFARDASNEKLVLKLSPQKDLVSETKKKLV